VAYSWILFFSYQDDVRSNTHQNSTISFRYVQTLRATLLGRKSLGLCVGTGRIIALFAGTHRRTLFWFICIQGNFPHHVSFTIRRNEVLLPTPRRLNHWNTPTCSNKFTARACSNSRFERPASLRLTSPE